MHGEVNMYVSRKQPMYDVARTDECVCVSIYVYNIKGCNYRSYFPLFSPKLFYV